MTFPSRRDKGYRAELAKAIFWACAWSALHSKDYTFWQSHTEAAREHRLKAWERLAAFTGGILKVDASGEIRGIEVDFERKR